MVITWYGQACFKIQSGELVVAIDPYGKEVGLTPPRFKTDILAITHGHFDHNNRGGLAGEPFVIDGPGEHEIKGVYVEGTQTFHDNSQGKERGLNTIYKIEVEGIRLLHMGDYGEEGLREEVAEKIGEVDILFIPVGGKFTIDGKTAAKIVKEVEPKIAIPMHYKIPNLKIEGLSGAEDFLKELGVSKLTPEEKLIVKKKDFEAENEKIKVAVLKPA